uniref:Putative secreted salivary protein n=1 Tax=Xenopsylla cheopis TaxID=163159 RepID=UPI0008FEAEF5|nr:Chain A, Putative secreted salivary protein [Xenopsylla cheopis]5K6D_B Chain B, Putative secreted salivary protein [Xenopsylla cheopis]
MWKVSERCLKGHGKFQADQEIGNGLATAKGQCKGTDSDQKKAGKCDKHCTGVCLGSGGSCGDGSSQKPNKEDCYCKSK